MQCLWNNILYLIESKLNRNRYFNPAIWNSIHHFIPVRWIQVSNIIEPNLNLMHHFEPATQNRGICKIRKFSPKWNYETTCKFIPKLELWSNWKENSPNLHKISDNSQYGKVRKSTLIRTNFVWFDLIFRAKINIIKKNHSSNEIEAMKMELTFKIYCSFVTKMQQN